MENIRKMVSSASSDTKAVETVKRIESAPWAIKYIGRKLNATCKEKFGIAEGCGFKLKLPWEGQESYVQHNAYDESRFEHELVVDVYSEGPAKGRIREIGAHHWEYWHTSSNWQDHSESHTSECRPPNDDEIREYEKLLNSWTEGGSREQIDGLMAALEHLVGEGKMKVFQNEGYLEIHFTGIEETKQNKPIIVNLDLLEKTLDMSHIRIEALFSLEYRKSHGLEKETDWQLQYVLNLFDVHSNPEMYPVIVESETAWLHDLFESCKNYRCFMNQDSDVWWRDAWWRLQELMSDRHRRYENLKLLQENYNTADRHSIPNFDHLGDYIGEIRIPKDCLTPDFVQDTGSSLTYYDKGQRKRYSVKYEVVNGIRWAYCSSSLGNGVAIDLSATEEVENLPNGVAIVPSRICGKRVEEIRALDKSIPKLWREVIVEADCEMRDLCAKLGITKDEYGDGEFFDDGDESALVEDWGSVSIGDGAFKDWKELENITIKKRASSLGSYAFSGCENLKTAVFNKGVSRIGTRCFEGCKSFENLQASSVSSISAQAFIGCSSLKEVNITGFTDTFGFIGKSAFEGCTKLKQVRITDRQSESDAPIDYLQKAAKPNISHRPLCLEKKCFYGCTGLELVEIPYMVKIVEDEAFAGCPDNCVIHHDGNDIWFKGYNAFGEATLHFWGVKVKYHDEPETMLSILMKKLGINRHQYLEILRKYSIWYTNRESSVLDIATGKLKGRLKPQRSHDDDWYDDGLSGGIWYDGYYCADATTLDEAETEYWNTH